MKNGILFLLFTLIFSFNSFSQDVFSVGDDVEYFDGLDWLESKIIEKGENKYLIYLDRAETKTGWISADDIQLLFKDDAPIIKRTIVVTETVVMPLYHVGDFVSYSKSGSTTLTRVMSLGSDDMYQLYIDTNRVETIWLHEKDITLVSTNFEDEVIEQKVQTLTFQVKDVLEYFDGSNWKRGTLSEINAEGQFKFYNSEKWYKTAEIRNLSNGASKPISVKEVKVGDKVVIFDGKSWIETEIIQIEGGKFQVFYNREQTFTKWAEAKDLQVLK
jgi:hypothetical protein